MMPRGFKPVGWVAAVGGAALSCYMLSLNVAAERAELAKIERQIVMAKTEIRALNTELGTRGRLQQLEHWNAEVLALSAPSANQFVENEVMLARFETKEKTIGEQVKVQMASASTVPAAPSAPAARPAASTGKKLSPVDYAAAADRAAAQPQSMLRLASSDQEAKATVIKAAAVKPSVPVKTANAVKAEPKQVAAKPEPKKVQVTAKLEPKKADIAPKAEPKKADIVGKAEPKKAKPATIEVAKKAAADKPTKTAEAAKKPSAPTKGKPQGGAGGQ